MEHFWAISLLGRTVIVLLLEEVKYGGNLPSCIHVLLEHTFVRFMFLLGHKSKVFER